MSKRSNTSVLPSENLKDADLWPFGEGVDEIVVRICRYEADMETPAAFQAVVRGRDRTRVWGVGIRANPVAALSRAVQSFFEPKTAGEDASNVATAAEENATRIGLREQQTDPPPKPTVEDLLS